jgi:hypothetical protein
MPRLILAQQSRGKVGYSSVEVLQDGARLPIMQKYMQSLVEPRQLLGLTWHGIPQYLGKNFSEHEHAAPGDG